MKSLVMFANALRKHWVGPVAGVVVIGSLVIWQVTGHDVAASIYWVVAVAAVMVAAYFAWADERARAEGNDADWSGFDYDLVEVPMFASVYVEQVIGEYESHPSAPNPPHPLAQKIIDKYRKKKEEKTTWGDLYSLERLVVELETTQALHARMIPLRARHAALVGTGGTPLTAFDATKNDPEGQLARAYVESALREVNRLLAVTACRERLRKRRLLSVGVIGLIALAFLIVLTAFLRGLDFKGSLWLVLVPIVGALGGLISSQRRVQEIPSVGESLTDMINLHFFRRSLAASAMSGAIFAVVLCLLFASGLLKGGLFPTVNLNVPMPLDPKVHMPSEQLAELLIWCFIAGFAERFVPDTLDRLVSRSAKPE